MLPLHLTLPFLSSVFMCPCCGNTLRPLCGRYVNSLPLYSSLNSDIKALQLIDAPKGRLETTFKAFANFLSRFYLGEGCDNNNSKGKDHS
ncbi:hypothetical protein RJT34_17031 [Clitoria ternatea]|uniref:Secreted protein n=1 Tax=Clitoria ternatea TaxID=43366 RepID=A0AAN9JAC5_CLITE